MSSSQEDFDLGPDGGGFGDDPTQVFKMMEDYEHSRRQSLIVRRKIASTSDLQSSRRDSIFGGRGGPGGLIGVVPPRAPDFAAAAASSPLAQGLKRSLHTPSNFSFAKAPRLGQLGPDPLQGLTALKDTQQRTDRKNREEQLKEMSELKSKLARLEADLVAERAKTCLAEDLSKRAEMMLKRERAEAEEKRAKLERMEKNAREELDSAKHQLRLRGMRETRRLEDQAEASKRERRVLDELEVENEDFSDRNRQLMEKVEEMEAKMEEHKDASLRQQRETAREVQALKSRLDEATEKERLAEGWRTELATARRKLQTSENEVLSLKKERDVWKDKVRDGDESQVERRTMRDRLARFPVLERENETLKRENRLLTQTMENADLLKEEMAGLKSSLERAEAKAREGEATATSLAQVTSKLEHWQHMCSRLLGTGQSASPAALESVLTDLRKQDLVMRDELVELKNKIGVLEAAKQDAESRFAEAVSSGETVKNEHADQGRLIKRLQRKLILVSKERDSYKSILDSYEHEITFTGGQFDKDKTAALEKVVANYKEMLEKVEAQLAAATSSEGTKELQKRVSELEEALAQANAAATSQGSSADDQKILHFKNNPSELAFAARQKEVAGLVEENEALKARVKLLEEGHTSNITMMVGQKVDEAASSEEVQQLRDELKRAEVRKERILDAFKKTSKDFREVCNELTGYRIDGLDNGQYRLTPKYAEQEGDHLLFRRGDSGELLLLETRFSAQLHDHINLHLNRQHSIPVFLAAVITDLFSKSTFDTVDYPDEEEEESDDQSEGEGMMEHEEQLEEEDEDEVYSGEEHSEGDEEEEDVGCDEAGDDDDPICID